MQTLNSSALSPPRRDIYKERCLQVFLPWTPNSTGFRNTDMLLRQRSAEAASIAMNSEMSADYDAGQLDACGVLLFPVQAAATSFTPSWRGLPSNPLCLYNATHQRGALRDNTQLETADEGVCRPTAGAAPQERAAVQQVAKPLLSSSAYPLLKENGMGRTRKRAPLCKEDYAYYCDACQKGFSTQEKFDTHISNHMYCETPGCGFTCRRDRAWKMEEHVHMLHNRPDAPDLADTACYLAQRRRRFPSMETIKQKIEELYYKAARGVVLPEERCRWMRQHGIRINKRYRSEYTYIAHGKLPFDTCEATPPQEVVAADSSHACPNDKWARAETASNADSVLPGRPLSSACHNSSRASSDSRQPSSDGSHRTDLFVCTSHAAGSLRLPSSSTSARSSTGGDSSLQCVGDGVQKALQTEGEPHISVPAEGEKPVAVPPCTSTAVLIGPPSTRRGTGQRRLVQRVESQRLAKQVPRYYVCNRCGTKGAHWLNDCPTKGNSLYERHMVWGEPRGVESMPTGAPAAASSAGVDGAEAPESSENALVPRDLTGKKREEDMADGGLAADKRAGSHFGAMAAGGMSTLRSNPSSVGGDEDKLLDSGLGLDSDAAPCAVSARRLVAPPVSQKQENPPGPNSCRGGRVVGERGLPLGATRIVAPVAAARLLEATARGRHGRGGGRGGRHGGASLLPPPPPEPTLYERLTEEDRLNEEGLLLQAIRFFVTRQFFC